jgi:putative nucleotidyltransferase with HDIG domain
MRRVAELTVAIAEELQLPAANARAASHAALLHDIGKLAMPESVLHKPGKLTDDEFAVLRQHPELGYNMVMQSLILLPAANAIRWHHERLDGSGYPDALEGHAIPIEARIVAVADVWDALTSDRVYRPALSLATARKILLDESGTKLDQSCVSALFSVLDKADLSAPRLARREQRTADRPLPSFLAS